MSGEDVLESETTVSLKRNQPKMESSRRRITQSNDGILDRRCCNR